MKTDTLLLAGLAAAVGYLIYKNMNGGPVVKSVTAQSPDWATSGKSGGGYSMPSLMPQVGVNTFTPAISEPIPVVAARVERAVNDGTSTPVSTTPVVSSSGPYAPGSTGGSTPTIQTITDPTTTSFKRTDRTR